MNPAALTTIDAGMARGNRRVLVGVGVSVAVHLLLMFAYRHTGQFTPVVEQEPRPIEVTIRPPPPPPAPRVEPAPRPPAEPAGAPRSARRSAPKRVIAVPQPTQEAPPDPFVVQQPEEAAPPDIESPKFDMHAAKQTARELAGQTRLGREGTALAQFPDPPLETESKIAKGISKAKRRNCKDGLPGGLLAPLFLMMDKKDHGCKW